MRIFTLGKNGIPLFFFALLLFSGTFSSYGQCPTVDAADSIQYFCDSQEAEVSQLTVTDTNGADVLWYEDQTTTSSLPPTTFLVSGTYYAGSASCAPTSRVAVEVRIASEPDILGIKASTTPTTSANRKESLAVIGVCVEDVNNPGLTVADLRTNAEDENNVRWYLNRTSQDELDPSTPLVNNTDYFAAIYSPDGECETNRKKTTVRFFSEAAPTGPTSQEFCAINNPTLGDIEASGDNRYFSSSTSQVELSPNTELENGKTYYVSALGEECESIDRLGVTVTVTEPIDLETTSPGIICELDVQETIPNVDALENFLLGLLGDGVPTNGTFSPTPTQLGNQYQNDADGLGDFTTTYTVGCDQVDLTLTVIPSEDANAGDDVTRTYDVTDDPVDLYGLVTEGAQDFGTFEGYPNGEFDPSSEGPGTYIINYTVDETSGCIDGSDSAVFTIMVNPCTADAGDDVDADFCRSDAEVLAGQLAVAENDEERNAIIATWLGDRDTNGTFTGDPATEIATKYADGVYPFSVSTTYTVGEGVCEDEASITFTVYEDAYAGEDAVLNTEFDGEPVELFGLLGNEAEEGGTWSSGDGTFDPATDAPGTYTYTVGEGCTDSATVTVTVSTDPNDPCAAVDAGTPGYGVVCLEDVPTKIGSRLGVEKYFLGLLDAGVSKTGTFNPTPYQIARTYRADEDGLGEFSTTYTITDGECTDSVVLTVIVVEEANAGEDATVTLDENDEPVNLFDYLGDSALQGGTWDTGNGTFDPATDEPGTFTYTVGYEGCMDSATVTVSVTSEPTDPCEGVVDAGGDNTGVVCITDIEQVLDSSDDIRNYLLNILDGEVIQTGTFNPSPSQLFDQYANDTDGLGDFSTTYTLTDGECSDSAVLTISVIDTEPADTGDIADVTICTAEDGYDLNSVLTDANPAGGTFYDEEGEMITNGILDISSEGQFTITYTITEDDSSCVTGTDSTDFTVTVTANTADAGEDNSVELCNSEVKNLTTTGVRNLYLNLLEDGVATNGTFNPTIQTLIDQYKFQSNIGDFTTIYTVGEGNCTDSAELTVTVLDYLSAGENATVNLEEDDTEEVDLFDALGGTPAEGGVWTDADGETVDGTFDPTTDAEGTYTYTVTSDNGCVDSATVTVVIGDPVACPEITDAEQSFCGTATVADLSPSNALWYTSEDGTDALAADTALEDDAEYFAGNADGSCSDRGMVTVTILDAPDAPAVTAFDGCVADLATVADLVVTADEGFTVQFYTTEDLNTPAAETDLLVDGIYFVTQATAEGCESEAAELTVTLDDSDAPTLAQGGNVFCEFDNATLADLENNLVGEGTITWYASETGTDPLDADSEQLRNEAIYYASLTPEGACESSDRLPVTVTLEVCEIVIPEAFSPNNDNINDYFVIDNISSEYPNHTLEIYNRWGNMVFNGKGANPGWDGTSTEGSFGSGVLPVGVYFYILYFNDGQTAPTQGRLYLSR
ncbi:T9SS type B sorting domain-containing protein [Salinimicrobium flavum]|uniref:Gliding motility-associated C-terminal domain-containing protein n=1 Tax=Salinimicrobium flavum TaxID=1737065 RepID=A0ABW5IZP2_9FLAO